MRRRSYANYFFPFKKNGSYSGCRMAVRPPSFVLTGREFEPGCLRIQSFCFFLPFAFESRVSFCFFPCNFRLLFFDVWVTFLLFCSLHLLANMYQVQAQREHMLDPHCSYSPVARSSLAIRSLFYFCFYIILCGVAPSCLCSRVSRAVCFPCKFEYSFFHIFGLLLPLLLFYM